MIIYFILGWIIGALIGLFINLFIVFPLINSKSKTKIWIGYGLELLFIILCLILVSNDTFIDWLVDVI